MNTAKPARGNEVLVGWTTAALGPTRVRLRRSASSSWVSYEEVSSDELADRCRTLYGMGKLRSFPDPHLDFRRWVYWLPDPVAAAAHDLLAADVHAAAD